MYTDGHKILNLCRLAMFKVSQTTILKLAKWFCPLVYMIRGVIISKENNSEMNFKNNE